ncbi:MAG: septum formation initiator family protein [Deltaproteobacteria bacterium]|jgi:cell division protein FtsB|nr:septum formation initiator family protein [Deltaproteobacteria bacterium]
MAPVLNARSTSSAGSGGDPPFFRRLYLGLDSVLAGKFFWMGLFFVLILVFMGYIFLSEDGFSRNSGLKEMRDALILENTRLEEENRQLLARLARLNTDASFLESQARKKLRYVKSHEIIFRLAEEPDLTDDEVRLQLD